MTTDASARLPQACVAGVLAEKWPGQPAPNSVLPRRSAHRIDARHAGLFGSGTRLRPLPARMSRAGSALVQPTPQSGARRSGYGSTSQSRGRARCRQSHQALLQTGDPSRHANMPPRERAGQDPQQSSIPHVDFWLPPGNLFRFARAGGADELARAGRDPHGTLGIEPDAGIAPGKRFSRTRPGSATPSGQRGLRTCRARLAQVVSQPSRGRPPERPRCRGPAPRAAPRSAGCCSSPP